MALADEIKVEVHGLEELQRDFKSLANKVTAKELQPVLKREASSFAAKLLPRTPLGPTGNLRGAVRAWTPKITARHPEAMARGGLYKKKKGAHAHIVEFGTTSRYTKSGAHRGFMPARHFIEPLANAEMPGMLRRIINEVYKVIDREWK